jgi:hypothetical protein
MSIDKTEAAFQILQAFPETRGDGHGDYLNKVVELYYQGKPDFRNFIPESWTRSRRKIQELYPELDERTSRTDVAEEQYRDLFGH